MLNMTNPLLRKHCIPCEGGIPPATDAEIQALIVSVPGWALGSHVEGETSIKTLKRTMTFSDFRAAMAFLRRVEDIAESEGHHPDFCVHYNRVEFTLFTHAVGGLHENDFILAAKIDAIEKTL